MVPENSQRKLGTHFPNRNTEAGQNTKLLERMPLTLDLCPWGALSLSAQRLSLLGRVAVLGSARKCGSPSFCVCHPHSCSWGEQRQDELEERRKGRRLPRESCCVLPCASPHQRASGLVYLQDAQPPRVSRRPRTYFLPRFPQSTVYKCKQSPYMLQAHRAFDQMEQ